MVNTTAVAALLLAFDDNLLEGHHPLRSVFFSHAYLLLYAILTRCMNKSNTSSKPIARKGLTLVYYGNGKGKTTAAVGLVVRAAGSGLNVYFLQFVKGEWPCGERDFFTSFSPTSTAKKKIGTITAAAVGKGFVKILGDKKPFALHKAAAVEGLRLAREACQSGAYAVVVLDEIISAYESKLLRLADIVALVRAKPPLLHLVLTGHVLPPQLKKLADLVSEVRMEKHPYYHGVLAQRGIDY